MKLGTDTGSFFNFFRNSMSIPEVGKGATILHWSDRSAYFVNEVSEDGKTVVIERAKAIRTDNNGMSETQSYEYVRDPQTEPETIKFTYGKWRRVYTNWEGKKETSPINIIFGTMREYFDYSF